MGKTTSPPPPLTWKEEIRKQWREADAVTRLAFWLVAALQVPFVILMLNTTFLSFDIDNMVYFMMHVIERVRVGAPIYVPASPGHSSPVYTPLYIWICGYLCRLLGSSLVWPRLVSLASTFSIAGMIAVLTWRNTRNFLLCFAAPGFVLATWSYAGLWANTLTADATHVAITMAGFFILRDRVTPARALAAGLAFGLGALTKQTGLAYVVAGSVLIFLHDRKLGVLAFLVGAGLFAGVAYSQNQATHGEFWKQTFLVQQQHPWQLERLWSEVLNQHLLGYWSIMTLMTLFSLVTLNKYELWTTIRKPEYFMCLAGVGVDLLTQPKYGSGATQGLVAYAGLSVCGCIGLTRLAQYVASARTRLVALVAGLQMAVLILPGVHDFRFRLIDKADREQYEQVAEVFRAGRTCYLYTGYIATTFGQPESGCYGDESTNWRDGQMVFDKPKSLNEPFYRQEFDYVILPTFADRRDPTVQAVLDNYKAIRKLPAHPRGVHGGNGRWEKIVFQAKRMFPEETGSPANMPESP